MPYEARMFFRLLLPAFVVAGAILFLMWVAHVVTNLPTLMGGQPVYPGLVDDIALGGLVLSVAIAAVQLFRFFRWTRGHGDTCFVCGCLLGSEQSGRFGHHRKCLGCRKNHAMARI